MADLGSDAIRWVSQAWGLRTIVLSMVGAYDLVDDGVIAVMSTLVLYGPVSLLSMMW